MSKGKYEAHITCTRMNLESVKLIADQWQWKTSEIARDIVLGDDTYYYLTKHFDSVQSALDTMLLVNKELIRSHCNVVRNKIELVVHDVRIQS
jgi:hypothetical protein